MMTFLNSSMHNKNTERWTNMLGENESPDIVRFVEALEKVCTSNTYPTSTHTGRIDAAILDGLRQRGTKQNVTLLALPKQRWPRVVQASWRFVLLAAVISLGSGLAAAGVLPGHQASVPLFRTIPVGAQPVSVAVDEQTGRAFVACDGDVTVANATYDAAGHPIGGGTVSILDTHSGAVVNTVPVGWVPGQIVVDEHIARVFVLNGYWHYSPHPGTVSMLDAHTGRLLHTATVGDLPFAMALDEQTGRIYVLNSFGLKANDQQHHYVTILDASTGAVLKSLAINAQAMAVDSQTGRVFLATSNHLIMIDARTATVLHTLPIAAGSMVVDHQNGRMFVGGISGKTMWVLNGRSGRIVQTIALHSYSYSSMMVDEPASSVFIFLTPDYRGNTLIGRLVILDAQRESSVLDSLVNMEAQSRSSLHAFTVGAGLTVSTVDTRTGHVLLALQGPIDSQWMPTGMGVMHVLDGRSGTLLASVPVGRGPSAVAIDERSDYAFVVNTYSSDVTMVDLSHL